MGIKTDFIEKLRLTPDGIKNFLETPLPEPPTVSYPTTKDEAIIVQGVLAAYILTAIKPFAGWMPVATLMRIGQHSNPLETITLTCLEYIQDSSAEKEITIEEPIEGQAYAPGDIRLIVKGKGKISTVKAATGNPNTQEQQITDLTSTDGEMFYGYIRLETVGDYTTAVAATFDDKDQTEKSASVHFTVSEDGDVQADLAEFDLAAKKVTDAADRTIGERVFDAAVGAVLQVAIEKLIIVVAAL